MPELVLAPETFIRFGKGSEMWIGVSGASAITVAAPARLLALLARVYTGADVGVVLAECPAAQRNEQRSLIQFLQRIGILVEPGVLAAAALSPTTNFEQSAVASSYCLKCLADVVYDLAVQLRAFGPSAEERLAAAGGTLPAQVLLESLAQLTSLQHSLT